MDCTLSNGGESVTLRGLPHGTEVGHIRTMRDELEDIGAPSSYTFAIDGRGVGDDATLTHGCTVTMRPKAGDKG